VYSEEQMEDFYLKRPTVWQCYWYWQDL
jgi:hypothetical protein